MTTLNTFFAIIGILLFVSTLLLVEIVFLKNKINALSEITETVFENEKQLYDKAENLFNMLAATNLIVQRIDDDPKVQEFIRKIAKVLKENNPSENAI